MDEQALARMHSACMQTGSKPPNGFPPFGIRPRAYRAFEGLPYQKRMVRPGDASIIDETAKVSSFKAC
jgi:hypothetical protein